MLSQGRPAIVLLLACAACSATPSVSYRKLSDEASYSDSTLSVYALQEIGVAISESQDKNKPDAILVEPFRSEHSKVKLAIERGGEFGVSTDIGIVKFDNTDIPKEIVVKVNDNRQKYLEKIGGILVSAVKIGGFSSDDKFPKEEIELPARFNISRELEPNNRGVQNFTVPLVNASITVGAAPVDAIEIGVVEELGATPYFFYAACRTAEISFRYKGKRYTQSIKVSDPSFLQGIRLPVDGKVQMHSQCGASVTGKLDSDAGAELTLIQTLLTQASLVQSALEGTK